MHRIQAGQALGQLVQGDCGIILATFKSRLDKMQGREGELTCLRAEVTPSYPWVLCSLPQHQERTVGRGTGPRGAGPAPVVVRGEQDMLGTLWHSAPQWIIFGQDRLNPASCRVQEDLEAKQPGV